MRFVCRVGQNRLYTECMYGVFGREITKYTVVYSVCIYGSGQPYALIDSLR